MEKIAQYVYLSTGLMDVFDSQVIPVLEYFGTNSKRMLHISMEHGYEVNAKTLEKRKNIQSRFPTQFIVQRRNLFDYQARRDAEIIGHKIESYFEGGTTVIHARGHANAYKAIMEKRKFPSRYRVHADLRGALWDEVRRGNVLRRLTAPYRSKLYLSWEKCVVEEADSISCVSYVWKEILEQRYNRKDITVIPTFTNNNIFSYSEQLRKEYRNKLDLGDAPALIYCGGTSYWQKLNDTVELYSVLRKKLKGLVMIFLTYDTEMVQQVVGGGIEPKYLRILSAAHHEVPGYLCAADIGVLLRDDIPTNRVSAPTKFGEYLCCGLPVIISPKIGDTENVIRQSSYGLVVSDPDKIDENALKKLCHLDRENIAALGRKNYSKDRFLKKLHLAYLGKVADEL